MHSLVRLLITACCLLLASAVSVPLLRAMGPQAPPMPSDPWTAVPKPSATPSEPNENDADSSPSSKDEEADDSEESDEADESSPSPPD
jgi:hypothetical protein